MNSTGGVPGKIGFERLAQTEPQKSRDALWSVPKPWDHKLKQTQRIFEAGRAY